VHIHVASNVAVVLPHRKLVTETGTNPDADGI
jgi:hypothetical protein